jgi:hypothetical protein
MPNPSVFVLGAQKCGTTTVAELLAEQPEIFVPSVKETYFFCDEAMFVRGTDWYRREFYSSGAAQRARLLCDATPFYLASPEALQRIAQFVGDDARFIVCLRDPVARAYSAYWHQRRLGNEPLEFEAALAAEPERIAEARAARGRWWRHAYIEVGRYGVHLQRAYALLGRERFLLLDGASMSDMGKLQGQLRDFLGLPGRAEQPPPRRANPAALPRSRMLQDLVIRRNPLKSMARALIPREARSAVGRRLLNANKKPFQYPAMNEQTRLRLRTEFVEDRVRLAALGIEFPDSSGTVQ